MPPASDDVKGPGHSTRESARTGFAGDASRGMVRRRRAKNFACLTSLDDDAPLAPPCRRRPVPIAGLVFVSWAQTFFGAAVVAVPACSNSDAGGITPITGIVVLADTLTAGHGCGTGPGEIFKYVVVVQIPGDAGGQNLNNDFIAAGAYDCFANGTFDNLCTYGSSASTSFSVSVFAFTAEQWTGALEDGEVTEAGAASGVVASAIATAPTSECSRGFLAPLELLSTLRATANWFDHLYRDPAVERPRHRLVRPAPARSAVS